MAFRLILFELFCSTVYHLPPMSQNSIGLAKLSGVMCSLVLGETPHTGRAHSGTSGGPTQGPVEDPLPGKVVQAPKWHLEFLVRREHKLSPFRLPEELICSQRSESDVSIWLLHYSFRGARMLKLSAKSGRMGRWDGHPLASVWSQLPVIPLSRVNTDLLVQPDREASQ